MRQRARAAFLAIFFRFQADSFSALAFPPLAAPSLPRATAAGFLVSGSGSVGGRLPVACMTVSQALRLTSRSFGWRLLARDGMTRVCHIGLWPEEGQMNEEARQKLQWVVRRVLGVGFQAEANPDFLDQGDGELVYEVKLMGGRRPAIVPIALKYVDDCDPASDHVDSALRAILRAAAAE